MATFEEIIRKHALQNALEHGGKANKGSVLGKVFASNPDLRGRAAEIHELADKIIDEVNVMSTGEQQSELQRLGGPEKVERREEKPGGLPPLPGAEEGRVVVRFAPNPDGAIHLGNARPAILSYEYAKMYRGEFILRYDDTDPKVKRPERRFYEWIREDLRWLGIRWDSVFYASRRLKLYHSYARLLIEKGGAYVCTCRPDAWKESIRKGFPCSCREMHRESQLQRWEDMLRHKFREGQAVVRVKTDINHPNPAVRDWPALRIVDRPSHPLNRRDRVWPLFNFASGIDDHVLGITHILRGQEHSTNEEKQRWMYRYFGWEYPRVVLLGRFLFPDMVLSKSLIREGIEKGEFGGWDDPGLGTIRALRRRGFQPDALRQLVVDIGPRPSDATIAFENLAAYNRRAIDRTASRYFFVAEPVEVRLVEPVVKEAVLRKHPANPKAGERKLRIRESVLVEKQDMENLRGKEVRLIGLFNVMLQSTSAVTSTEVKGIPKIHWLPPEQAVKAKVIMPGKELDGFAEKNVLKEKAGSVIQFERFGFCRLEKKAAKPVQFVFGHK